MLSGATQDESVGEISSEFMTYCTGGALKLRMERK